METPIYNPCTVDQVFRDFRGRRAAMLKALTTDVELFFRKCDPEKENLCLYGFPDETWEVSIPAEEVPPELPEPALGINFARDGMERKDWLSLVAVHSDAWLFAVAFYYGARFDKNDRERLFNMMNELPTVFDIVTGRRTASKDNRTGANSSGNKAKSATKPQKKTPENHKRPVARQATPPSEEEEDEEDEEEEHGDTYCGICAHAYTGDEFWIGCDICQKWFHGKCVKVTPARAEHIKQYKCPSCSNKRARV